MRKKLFTTIISALIAIYAFAYSGGNGSKDNPYLISSKADMEQLATNVNGGQTYEGIYFLLTRDLTGENDTITTVVGRVYDSKFFSGIFNGSGYEIAVKNSLTINGGQYSVYNIDGGVFGFIQKATILNLKVSGYISLSKGFNAEINIGGVCGYSVNSNIHNCSNNCNIFISDRNWIYSGGICGRSELDTNIANCYNTGSVYANINALSAYSGGISGTGGTITNCYNIGDISGKSSTGISGGIATITNCYNTGNILSTSTAGGIGGGTIQNCFVANCEITNGTDATRANIGRINFSNANTNNCYADGNITLNGDAISSQNTNSKDGKDATLVNFQNQSWLQSSLNWDFENTWGMSDISSVNQGLPIFKTQLSSTSIEVPNTVFLQIYPNPAQNFIHIKSKISIEKIEIYNQSGQCVLINDNVSEKLDISSLQSGFYLARIYTNGNQTIKKIIINK